MKDIKKLMITLVALFAMTAGAWAEDLSEAFTTATSNQLTYTGTHFTITGQSVDSDGLWITGNNSNTNQPYTVTISAINGETITRIEAVVGYNSTNSFTVVATPGTVSGSYSKDGTITISNINASTVTLSSSESNNKLLQFRTWTVYYTAAPSGPEVAWNKAEKTGSFTMPGGNVTLEPEYFPQAALTAAPTAINDVPATTDGAIVEAGTVANIGETTTAQGTVMYYVSTTEMTDAALLALAADQWTADVPTAADLAQGEAHVYYYVRGNDSDTDDENFSDGDILSANALTVTIAAEPTYAITLKEGTEDVGEWTISPAEATKGTTITATYSGTKRVKSVKAVKKGGAADPAKAYLKWDADQKKLVATEIPTTANKVQDSNENIEWAGTYVVEEDVTISGEIKLTGDVELIIKDGVKLTVNRIIHTQSGASLSVYGQTQMSGELNVTNQGSDAIFALKSLAVHSCKVRATSPASDGGGVYNTTTLNVYGGSLDAEYTGEGSGHGIILKKGGALNIYGGEVKAVGKGDHENYSYGIKSSSSSEVANVKVYGGKLWAECADNKAFRQINLTTEAGFNGKIETSDNGSSWTEYTSTGTPDAKYVRAGY